VTREPPGRRRRTPQCRRIGRAVPTIAAVTPADSVAELAQNLAEDGMVMKAVLIYDVIDEEGERNLNFIVTEKTATWDLQGMLTGVLEVTGLKYRKPT
jgi:hypothetical protein